MCIRDRNDTVGSINSYISYIIFCFHKDDVVIGLNCFSIFQFADIFYRPCIVFVWFSGIRKVLVCQCFCIIIFCQQIFIVFICSSVTVKPPYLPYGKKRKLSLSSFKNDLFILHLCRNCLFWRLPSQCFQLFQVCMDLPLCIKLIVVFCPKILIFHTVFQDMINRY